MEKTLFEKMIDVAKGKDDGEVIGLSESVLDLPPLKEFDQFCAANRDDMAKSVGINPEDLELVGVKLFYLTKKQISEHELMVAIAIRGIANKDYAPMILVADRTNPIVQPVCESECPGCGNHD